jgi:hypothetical protein
MNDNVARIEMKLVERIFVPVDLLCCRLTASFLVSTLSSIDS